MTSFEDRVKAMRNNPKFQEILEAIGSDYDDDGIAYWEKNNNEMS